MSYPAFSPPGLAGRAAWEFSGAEARQYRDWLLSVMPDRTRSLLGFLEMPGPVSPELLDELGKHIADAIVEPEFSSESSSGRVLTDEGYALAADAGLLVAQLLLDRHPSLRWHIARSAKTDLDYNLPVLTGFRDKETLDPIRGGVSAARRLANRKVGTDAFTILFREYSDLAP